MLGLVLLALLVQGPRDIQIKEGVTAKTLPPVAAGTAIPVALVNRLSTKNIQPGANIYSKTVFPISINNEVVIPEGTSIVGKVVEVKQPGRIKGKPSLTITFQTLVMPNGLTTPIYASLGGSDTGKRKGEATVEGDSSRGKDIEDITIGAGKGGLSGAIWGGKRGAGIGAGVGAGVGLAEVLIRRGEDLTLERGTIIEVVLDQPVQF